MSKNIGEEEKRHFPKQQLLRCEAVAPQKVAQADKLVAGQQSAHADIPVGTI